MRGAFSSKQDLLFDLDGTLVDSIPAHVRAYRSALQPCYPQLAASFDYAIFAGQPTRQVFSALGIVDDDELFRLTRSKQEHYRAALERGEVELFAGVRDLLTRLQEEGRGLYLITGASRVSVRRVIMNLHIDTFFAGVIAAEDTRMGKPSAEPYLLALSSFGLDAGKCLAIEDGESGIRSAQSAGIDAVLVHATMPMAGVLRAEDFGELALLL